MTTADLDSNRENMSHTCNVPMLNLLKLRCQLYPERLKGKFYVTTNAKQHKKTQVRRVREREQGGSTLPQVSSYYVDEPIKS